MGEQVDAKLLRSVKKTQDILGKHIKRPPLTEKNLMRPPFRFLHDLIMTAMSNNGFMKGKFSSQELESGNLTTRELKTAFMTKVLQFIKEQSSENLDAKVSKILAGQEPEKTNELLQAMGKILEQSSQGDGGTEEAVAKPKIKKPVAKTTGTKVKDESSPYAKKPPGPKAPVKGKPADPKETKRRASVVRDPSPAAKTSVSKAKPATKTTEKISSKDAKQKKPPVSASGDDGGVSFVATEVVEDLEEAQEESLPPEVAGPSSAITRRGSITKSSIDVTSKAGSGSSSAMSTRATKVAAANKEETEIEATAQLDTMDSGSDTKAALGDAFGAPALVESSESPTPATVLHEHDINDENENDNAIVDDETTTIPEIPDPEQLTLADELKTPPPQIVSPPSGPPSALNSRRRPPSSFAGSPLAPVAEDSQPVKEDQSSMPPSSARPHTSQFRSSRPPTSARPPSARPAPPRPKSARFQEKEESFRPPTGRVANVLLDSDEPDDENYVVHEVVATKAALTDLDETPELDLGTSRLRSDDAEDILLPADQRGLLVNQILETQKELEEVGRQGAKKTDIDREALGDKDKMKSRESNALEVEKLRNLIQMTAKSANPLGKLLDFIREDADAMHREMKKWQEESRALDKMITAEQEKTQTSLEPLHHKLQEIDNRIQDQEDAIDATKMTILRQEERIRKILVGLDRVKPRGPNDPIPTSADLQQMVTKSTNDYPLFKVDPEEPKRVYRPRNISAEPEPQRTYPGLKEIDPSDLDFLRY